MVKKKSKTKKSILKKKSSKSKQKSNKKDSKKIDTEKFPTLDIKTEHAIANDFGVKVYKKFDKLIKAIILFGSTVKKTQVSSSDIDLIFVIDDVSGRMDQELIAWYREELDKIVQANPYSKSLHINTVKLSTWWEDLMRGDPTIINVLRYGEAIIDSGGFFEPVKFLLLQGKIRSTPEAIYSNLQRAPIHLARSKASTLGAIEGLFWAMVDSAHAALIAAKVIPPSPEHIAIELKQNFVDTGKLKIQYVTWYRDLFMLHKEIGHGKRGDIKGIEIDEWEAKAKEFLGVMTNLVNQIMNFEKE
jgi:predicted nucleotidyltransferase